MGVGVLNWWAGGANPLESLFGADIQAGAGQCFVGLSCHSCLLSFLSFCWPNHVMIFWPISPYATIFGQCGHCHPLRKEMKSTKHVLILLTHILKTPCQNSTQRIHSGVGLQWFFLSWHAAKSFIKNLTLESFIPTNMLSINKKTMRLGVTSIASKVPDILGDTVSWLHLPRHLVRFSHAFPLDSFSRAAWTRSHVRCWQLSSLGKNLEFRYLQVMLIDIIRFTIPTP